MQQYVAFDVSKQSSEAVIVDEAGNRLVSRKVATDPLAMAAFVAKYGENVVSVGFEVGPLSTWLYHEMKGAGLPVVCIDSWRARAALSARLNKTDRTDAAGLADLLRAGFHHPVYVKSYAAHEVRTLLKARDSLVAQRRTQNRQRGRTPFGDCSRPSGWSWARVRVGGSPCWSRKRSNAGRRCARRSSRCSGSGAPPARRPPRCIANCGRWPGPTPIVAG